MTHDDGTPLTIYIAGPMTGYQNYNYPAFEEARAALEAAGYTTLSPTDIEELNPTGKTMPWDWYMRHALRMVLNAHAVAILPDWGVSRGARLEIEVAMALQLPVLPAAVWLERAAVEKSTVEDKSGV